MTTTTSTRFFGPLSLPAKLGDWGMILNPIVLGLLVALSWAGGALAAAALGLFLLRRPLWTWRTNSLERPRLQMTLLIGWLLLAVLGLAGAVWLAGWTPLWPLLVASPVIVAFLFLDSPFASPANRDWLLQTAGYAAFGAFAASIALASDWATEPAIALWIALVAYAMPTVLYLRAQRHRDDEEPYRADVHLTAHVVALMIIGWLIASGWLPLAAIAAFGLLIVRAVWGMSDYQPSLSAGATGLVELGWGLLVVIIIGLSYSL